MDPLIIGAIFIGLLIILVFAGIHIAFAMGIAGVLGILIIKGVAPVIQQVAFVAIHESHSFTLAAIPLYILMGQLVFYAGIADDLYKAAHKWLGRLPGGLAIATTYASAFFGAVCGSSGATAATIGSIAYPIMKKYKYDDTLSTGCIAAAGTLAILIPPSLPMIVYGIMCEQSIGKLFIAGIFPGLISATTYSLMIVTRAKMNPALAPLADRFPWKERFASVGPVWPIVVLFLTVIGGIYLGVFTATEGAGVGCFFAFIIGVGKGMSLKNTRVALYESAKLTAMIALLIIGGILYSRFLAQSGLIGWLSETLGSLPISRYWILLIMIGLYAFLGCIMDALAMIILTLPVFYPIIVKLGFDPIWFGVIVTKMIEVGLLTPPVGLNCFIVAGVTKEVPLEKIFKGISYFLLMDVINLALFICFPAISTWLPNLMIG